MKGNMASAGEALMFFCKCTVFFALSAASPIFSTRGHVRITLAIFKGPFFKGIR